jgi:hypothetical protein
MDPGRKRIGSIAESATSSHQRSKRAKYAPVAWYATTIPEGLRYTDAVSNECKKKKLKCVREEGDEICKRCDVNKVECIFAPTAQPAKEDSEPSRRRSTQEPQ